MKRFVFFICVCFFMIMGLSVHNIPKRKDMHSSTTETDTLIVKDSTGISFEKIKLQEARKDSLFYRIDERMLQYSAKTDRELQNSIETDYSE